MNMGIKMRMWLCYNTSMANDSKQERERLWAETDKLSAEADHFRIDAGFIGVRVVLQGAATGAAVFGVMIGAAKMFGAA
ncbi:MAG: hypothetical protein HOC23_24135 [Halieaceae bacterium]|nr:hypothetical protein [Halieaceae bacterium]